MDPGVAGAGGLHILATERHEAVRIDRQLAGRAARQGDPGSVQFFPSLENSWKVWVPFVLPPCGGAPAVAAKAAGRSTSRPSAGPRSGSSAATTGNGWT
jgi:hypothetical protein